MPRLIAAPDRPSRWKLLMRRQRRRVRPFTLLLLGLLGCFLLLIAAERIGARAGGARAGVAALRQGFGLLAATIGLRVHDVVIEGRANTPQPALDAAIGVAAGAPILGFSLSEIRERLEQIAWVQSATVERRLPDTLVVALVERRPFAIWQNQGNFSLIDHDGQAVAGQDPGAFGKLPLVVGAGAPAAAAALLDALDNYPALKSHVVAAVRVGERRWNLHLTNGGDVMLPEVALPAALKRLAQLQDTHALLDRPLQVVDLRLPDRLVLRPQPADLKGAGG